MQSKTIFWADDDPEDLEIGKMTLEELAGDLTMVPFLNGMQLLNHLFALPKDRLPDLIVLDINMPILNGKETLIILKTDPHFKDIPIVMFTTSNSATDRHFCHQYETEMFTKPRKMEDIENAVRRMLTYMEPKAEG